MPDSPKLPYADHSAEAVHFEVPFNDTPTRAVISREALTEHFEAEDHPEGWVAAFHENRDAIEAKALETLAVSYSNPLILGAQLFFS